MLPFLDLCLHKSPHNITFSIYRKPTTTDNLIPFDSIHPFSHKLAGLNALLFRLFKIPMSPTHFQEEYNIIKQIAANNAIRFEVTRFFPVTRNLLPPPFILTAIVKLH
ncbi:hypothetical protein RI129_010106 [Pyrocoelia pectoralis]|uniref:Helix-turn-helix domain-containing protein n=1 Tax=Pyrocoelia pectoralis TaxID=417401 RepID=A0AAN7V8L0_9COLE